MKRAIVYYSKAICDVNAFAYNQAAKPCLTNILLVSILISVSLRLTDSLNLRPDE